MSPGVPRSKRLALLGLDAVAALIAEAEARQRPGRVPTDGRPSGKGRGGAMDGMDGAEAAV